MMKKLITIICIAISFLAEAQMPAIPGFTNINQRYQWISGAFYRTIFIPAGTTPTLNGAPNLSGALYIDSVANKFHFFSSGQWREVSVGSEADTDSVYSRNDSLFFFKGETEYYTGTKKSEFGNQDSLFTGARHVNQAGYPIDFKYGPVNFRAKDSIGVRYEHDFGSPLTGTITAAFSTATPTISSGKLNLTGGAFNQSNYFLVNKIISVPNFTITWTVVANEIDGDSYGFYARLVPINGNGASYLAHYLTADTTRYVTFTTGNQVPVYASHPGNRGQLNFQLAAGDTLDCVMRGRDKAGTVSMFNRRTGVTSRVAATGLGTGTCNFSLGTYGGNWDFIGKLQIRYDDVFMPGLAAVGTSITDGSSSSNYLSNYVALAGSNLLGGYINMGHPAEASQQGEYSLDELINYIKPWSALWAMSENDRNGFVNIDSFTNRSRRWVQTIKTALPDTKIIIMGSVPQSSGSIVEYNDSLRSIALSEGVDFIDAYALLVNTTGTAMFPIYNSGDGIHMSQQGHNVLGGALKAVLSKYIPYGSYYNISPLTFLSDSAAKAVLAVNQNNDLGLWDIGVSNSFIKSKLRQAGEEAGLGQPANIFLGGTGGQIHARYLTLSGSGTIAAPSFQVTSTGVTQFTGFAMGSVVNGTASSGINIIGSGTKLAFSGGAFVQTESGGTLTFKNSLPGPGTGTTGWVFTNIGNKPASAYKIISGRIFDGTTEKERMWVNYGGGIWSDTASGYMRAIDYSEIPGNGFLTKTVIDSLIAAYGFSVGAAINNNNAGSGNYPWLNEATQALRRARAGWGFLIDSATSGALTFTADTSAGHLATKNDLATLTTDHNSLTNLTVGDVHTQYMKIAGRSGGQTLIGGTGTTDDLILQSTSGAGVSGADIIVKGGNGGSVEFARFLNSGFFGLGTNAPTTNFEISGSGNPLTGPGRYHMRIMDLTAFGVDVGPALVFGGNQATSSLTNFGAIGVFKENSTSGNNASYMGLYTRANGGNLTKQLHIASNGNSGFGVVPTAVVHLKAGTATASTAPLKFTSGSLLTTPEAGAIQFLNGLVYIDSSTTSRDTIAGRRWVRDRLSEISIGGSGTVNSGAANRLAYYASSGSIVDDLAAITANRALISDANGLPTHSSVTNTEIGYVSGVTSSIQTQLDAKADELYTSGVTSVGNVGTGEDDLISLLIPGGTLANTGDAIEFWGTVELATTTNNKTIKIFFGTTAFYNSTPQPQAGGVMMFTGRIYRTGPTSQKLNLLVNTDAGLYTTGFPVYGIATQNLSSTLTLKITGEATTNDDIVCTNLEWRKLKN